MDIAVGRACSWDAPQRRSAWWASCSTSCIDNDAIAANLTDAECGDIASGVVADVGAHDICGHERLPSLRWVQVLHAGPGLWMSRDRGEIRPTSPALHMCAGAWPCGLRSQPWL